MTPEKPTFKPEVSTSTGVFGQYPPLFLGLLLLWALINITQASLTEITHDEAYYWMYSRFMDWGYFDHPPMIALFIKIGIWLMPGEPGVRLLTIIAQIGTLTILWHLIENREANRNNILLFFGLAASVVMFEVYGFVATPDSPLLLFSALFLLAYKRFIARQDTPALLWLAFSMAAMMYSKYHGILVILFVMASNPRLILLYRFWLAGIIAIMLFMPHILWQIDHDYPSLRYHLIARSRPANLRHVLEYLPNQLVSFNPFFLGLGMYAMFKTKAADLFERALYFIVFGFLLFFLVTTLRGHVEPHWTITAALPMIILLHRRISSHPEWLKYTRWVLFPTLLILLLIRVALIIDFLPIHLKFQGEKAWHTHLASIAGDTPVIFRNSYQLPSVYTFYTGHPAHSLNGVYYRHTQYDIWPFEQDLFGKPVLLVTNRNDPLATPYIFPDGKPVYLHRTEHFFAVQKLQITYELASGTRMRAGDTLHLKAELYNPYPYAIPFDVPYFPVTFHTMFVKSGNDMTVSSAWTTPVVRLLKPGERIPLTISFEVPDICTRTYNFGITLQAGINQEAFNSLITNVKVLEK